MTIPAVISVDIGTSSAKGVLVSTDGHIRATAVREHAVDRPHPGWVEMDASIWWSEYVSIVRELLGSPAASELVIEALGVSGMGPCAPPGAHLILRSLPTPTSGPRAAMRPPGSCCDSAGRLTGCCSPTTS
jgi:FGGY family of carbohydrate kinases, N-terminal domain